jgi:UDP-N-acetylmuramoyl-tripeptide--D-alanyl-D-alanine ligase
VAQEKGDLFASLSPEAVAIVNSDDPAAVAQLARTRARRVLTFGTSPDADYRLIDRSDPTPDGARVRIERRNGSQIDVRLPVAGQAAAVDFAAAMAAAEALAGPMDSEHVGRAIGRHFQRLPGRMHARRLSDGTIVLDDTYNANPDSVRAALRTLAELSQGRRAIVVLGEMRELGSSGPAEHSALGDAIAESGACVAVSCGGLADLAVLAAERSGVSAIRAASVEEAVPLVVGLAAPADVFLVKGSRSVGTERVVQALMLAGGGEVARGGAA